MGDSNQTLSANFRDKIVKAGAFRICDEAARDATAYVDLIEVDSAPSGRYGRDTTATLLAVQRDAASTEDVLWWLAPSAVNWTRVLVLSDLAFSAISDKTISAGGALTVTDAFHTIRGAGGLADNLDTISGMTAPEICFLVCGAEAITVRDAATGGGNIAIRGNASITLATGDILMCTLVGSVVYITPLMVQAGVPSEAAGTGATGASGTDATGSSTAAITIAGSTDAEGTGATGSTAAPITVGGSTDSGTATNAMSGATAAGGTGATGAEGTGSVTGATAADGTGAVTGTSAAGGTGATGSDGTGAVTGSSAADGTGAVTGSSAASGTGAVTGSTAADGTGATGSDGTGAVTGSTAAEGTGASGSSTASLGGSSASSTASLTGSTASDGAVATSSSGTETIGRLLPAFVFGNWAVDGDGARTNGGGLCGTEAVLTNQGPEYAMVCDYNGGAPQYARLAESNTTLPAVYAANFQLWPDAEAENDFVAFGVATKCCEIALDLGTVAVYNAADSACWEYSQGSGTWAALPAGTYYDGTDSTAYDGMRPFQRDGALVFLPPSDWATDTVNGTTAYWIRSRVTATPDITTIPIANTVEHDVVTGNETWIPPHAGSLTAIRVNDAAATVHAANAILFVVLDQTSGESRAFSWSVSHRRERLTCTTWALTTAARLAVFVYSEDGTNEPSNVAIELEYSLATSNHTHTGGAHTHGVGTIADGGHTHGVGTIADSGHTHTGPSHSHDAGTLAGPAHTHTGPSHTHAAGTLAGPSHSHDAGTLAGPSHTHAAGTLAGPAHTHTGPSHSHDAGTLAGPSHTHDAGTLAGPSHTHTGPSHSHDAGTLAATDSGHTHTLGAATATDAGHTHTGPSHTHGSSALTATDAGHTHTGPSHTHTGPSHVHNV